MFHPLDLVFPIGFALLVSILCAIGILKAKEIPAKVICIVVALFFVSTIPGWYMIRGKSIKPDYVGLYGLQVKEGSVHKCNKTDTEDWSKWLVEFWVKKYPICNIQLAFRDVLVLCLDKEESTLGAHIKGYTTGKKIAIFNRGDQKITESLFKHEMSHQILSYCGVAWYEKLHHEYFKKYGLGH